MAQILRLEGAIWYDLRRLAQLVCHANIHRVGNVVYAHIPGQSFVVLNSLEAVTDLLDGRSANYSDRPNLTMIGELVGVENVC
jgi:hypothetical protein